MEFLDRDLNVIADNSTERGKRRAALDRVDKLVRQHCDQCEGVRLNHDQLLQIARTSCRALEDKAERCRELAIGTLSKVIGQLPASVLEYILPSIVSRIGLEDRLDEESEELRLQLHDLAIQCLTAYPNDVGRTGYLEYYTVLLMNCLKDPFPDLKKAACKACVTLCEVEPKHMKHPSQALAKTVKLMCLQHKHSAVRVEAVRAFGQLVKHGAHEIMGDTKDEQDNRTTVHFLYILCNDHSESVRLAMVDTLSILLLDITERYDQHRRVIPHVLLMLTDESEAVRLKANTLMLRLGKLFMGDNEDNTIDLSKRRINMKDIEWYGDDEYPEMNFETATPFDCPGWQNRPMLGARQVVADCARNFLDNVLKDVTVMDWMIPFSNVNKRVAALRILTMLTWYIETDVVQYAPQILTVLYKVLQDDNKEISVHAHFAVEMIGKFLTAEQYLPFIVSKNVLSGGKSAGGGDDDTIEIKPSDEQTLEETGDMQQEKRGNKVVTKVSAAVADQGPIVMPTLFSSAANVTKTSVLIAFRYFLLGSKATLSHSQAELVVAALIRLDVSDVDSPPLLKALVNALVAAIEVLAARGLVCTPDNPMPPEVRRNVKIQTFDSKLLYALLCLRSSDDKAVVAMVSKACSAVSTLLSGTETGLYDIHFGRILYRKATTMPVDAFEALVTNAADIGEFAEPLVGLFIQRLSEVNYTHRVASELHFFSLLRSLLEARKIPFTGTQLETFLRGIVLVHGKYAPGPTAHLFRKLALSTLRVMLMERNRVALKDALDTGLVEKIVSVWLGGVDGDDGEMRLTCIACLDDLCELPLQAGQASDILDNVVLRFDDSSDPLRCEVVKQFNNAINSSTVDSNFLEALRNKIIPTVRTLLTHMDDHVEQVGLKDAIKTLLVDIGKRINRDFVIDLARQASEKHVTPRYCEFIIQQLE